MRIYDNCHELMSETGRNIWEMGSIVKPKSYQNKNIEDNDDYITKELICEQYCLLKMPDERFLFAFDNDAKPWAKAELVERLNSEITPINPGTAWELRKDVWEQFLVKKHSSKYGSLLMRTQFDYSYNERLWRYPFKGGGYLNRVVKELKRNPDTRQAVVLIHEPEDSLNLGGIARIPCSMYYDFLIRKNGRNEDQLNICYHQRSADFVTHFGNDIWLAWKLMEWVAKQVGVKPGYLYHTIDSLHSYKKDWEKLKTPIENFIK